MKKTALGGASIALACGLLGIACGDDDSAVTPNPDSGTTPDSSAPTNDSGGTTDAGTDSAPPSDASDGSVPSAPLSPLATTRIANAINPYGLRYASDGFLYVSGATIDNGRKLAVWRYKDGVLDTTFGTGGVISTAIGTTTDVASYDLVEISAGNFVVQANAGGKVWLVKLTSTGGVFAFGTPVFVKFGFDETEGWPVGTPNAPAAAPANMSWGIALDKSNAATPKIVVFSHGAPAKTADPLVQRIDNDRWVTRVVADTLAFDTGFNAGAPYTTDGDGKKLNDNSRRGIVLADGSILSGGYTDYGTGLGNHVVLVKLLATGAVDATFGFGTTAPGVPGQTKFNPFVGSSGFAECYGVVRQSNGFFVTTGYGNGTNFDVPSKNLDLVSFRVKPDGLDTTWGKLGNFAWQSEPDKSAGLGAAPYTDRGRDLAILPDDRTVHVGVYDDYASVYVLDKNGKPDPSSGVNGVIEYSYPAAFFRVAVSPDGKQVAATTQSLNQTTDAGAPLGSVLAVLKVGN